MKLIKFNAKCIKKKYNTEVWSVHAHVSMHYDYINSGIAKNT